MNVNETSFDEMKTKAGQGDAEAQYLLGAAYGTGKGTGLDVDSPGPASNPPSGSNAQPSTDTRRPSTASGSRTAPAMVSIGTTPKASSFYTRPPSKATRTP